MKIPIWEPYFMRYGQEFFDFWREFLQIQERRILYVAGSGFDPRMGIGYKAVVEAGGTGIRDLTLIDINEGATSPSVLHNDLSEKNVQEIKGLCHGRGELRHFAVDMWADIGRAKHRVGSIRAEQLFDTPNHFSCYTDIVIDVSSLPRGIYFSVIGKCLYLIHQTATNTCNNPINLHVIAVENPELDKGISDIDPDASAQYIHGLDSGMDGEGVRDLPTLWLPILGENQLKQMEIIYDRVSPREICPILPSPSLDPRRMDCLILEYHDLLFNQWRIDPRNIIYASEHNPFEVYRQITQAAKHYQNALAPLGGCKVAISALSSKLLSVGALLAVYETLMASGQKVGLAHVDSQGYEMTINYETVKHLDQPYIMCIAGEFYAS